MSFCTDYLSSPLVYSCIKISILLLVGLPIIYTLSHAIAQYIGKRINPHSGFIASKIVAYGGISYMALLALHEFGFNVTALLGAAGVIGVALGFASQTSMSNLIAGIFLLLEKAFEIGDEITFETATGIVESIDLFSVKIRTSDNTLVRIPNELIIKQKMTNLSYFAKRKLLFTLVTSGQTDMKHFIDEVRTTFSEQSQVVAPPEIHTIEFCDNQYTVRMRVPVKRNDIKTIREELLVIMHTKLTAKGLAIQEFYEGTGLTSAESVHVRITTNDTPTV